MRVVLDTNVIISGLLWRGTASFLLQSILRSHTLCLTTDTLGELEEVLGYEKFHDRMSRLSYTVREFVDLITEHAIVLTESLLSVDMIKDDPDDNRFLEAALATHAEVIVSGDRHLLKLKEFHDIPILTPRGFLKLISSAR